MINFSTVMDNMQPIEQGYSFCVSEDWGQGRTVFGGMQGAIAVKAMRDRIAADIPLRSLQITFIGPVIFAPAEVHAVVLRQGKSATQVQAQIIQDGQVRLIAIGIFGVNRASEIHDSPLAPEVKVSVAQAEELGYLKGSMPAFTQHFNTRLAKSIRLFSGAKAPSAVSYVKHRDAAALSDFHLVAIGDIAPPVAMAALRKFAPASSMNWQLEFVQTPAQLAGNTWLRVDADMIAGVHGYNWQNTNFWDEQGQLVMLSRQCVAVFG